jgi:hypothetical protein
LPAIPSPLIINDELEIVVGFTNDSQYCLIPVTHENGTPPDYEDRQWYAKGRQLDVDSLDFPKLAKTGLHSEQELDQTLTITGKSIQEITKIGRPGEYSFAGFMAQDEDIISVLKGDNRLVTQLGFSHPNLAKPLFHIFNIIITVKTNSEHGNIGGIFYNQRKIYVRFWGHKGWQQSIFNDEILGYWEIEIWRDLDEDEKSFLATKFMHLSKEEMSTMIQRISCIHTGEMVPYYIMRYGFYEGHTDYRADPIAITFIFGLKNIEDIHYNFNDDLYKTLITHYTINMRGE